MSLHLHRALRADALADGLGRLLATPLPDPFAGELVVVPARGMERWLSQRLSHVLGAGPDGDGVCAAVAFRSPGSLVAEITGTRDDDPWAPDTLAWPLLDVIDASLDEPWAATLARHLGHGHGGDEADLRMGRRFSVARRLARLFASYAGQRPSLVADWSAGRDTDGSGRAARRRPRLAARAVATPGRPGRRPDPARAAGRHRGPAARGSRGVRPAGPAVAVRPHPAVGHRDRAARRAGGRARGPRLAAASLAGAVADPDRPGRRGRACHRRQPPAGAPPAAARASAATRASSQRALSTAAIATDEELPAPPLPDTLLGMLQSDLAADLPARRTGRVLAADDRSVQVHACHGVARQVDVLREVLLGLLADDPTLEPRDVLVMCPDIETYAPLIEAGFGLGDVVGAAGHPAHRLRVRLADRAPGQTNPLLGRRHGAARPRRRPGAGDAGARPGPHRAGAPAVRVQRRRPRPARHLGARVRGPVGLRRRAPRASSGSRRTSRTPGSSGSTGC